MLIEIILLTLSIVLFTWHQYNFQYWKRRNVKYIQPRPFMGSVNLKYSFIDQLYQLYEKPEVKNEPFVGAYIMNRPILLLKDLDLIKRIMIKDFNNFADHVLKPDPVHDSITANALFFSNSMMWKELRSRTSTLFSSGKIKQMYMLMQEVSIEEIYNKYRHIFCFFNR